VAHAKAFIETVQAWDSRGAMAAAHSAEVAR
jgi:hypothetical protein